MQSTFDSAGRTLIIFDQPAVVVVDRCDTWLDGVNISMTSIVGKWNTVFAASSHVMFRWRLKQVFSMCVTLQYVGHMYTVCLILELTFPDSTIFNQI